MNLLEIEYVSRKSRIIFSCPAQDSALLKTVRESLLAQQDSEFNLTTKMGDYLVCGKCFKESPRSESSLSDTRKVILHTL